MVMHRAVCLCPTKGRKKWAKNFDINVKFNFLVLVICILSRAETGYFGNYGIRVELVLLLHSTLKDFNVFWE